MKRQQQDNLGKILKMFKSYNLDQQALLTKLQLTNVLTQQARRKLKRDFNPQIINQIWGQAETNSRGQSTMRTFAKIIENAINILESRLYRINSNEAGIPYFQKELNAKNSLLAQLESEYESGFLQNYQKINVERKNKAILENKIRELQVSQGTFQHDLEELRSCIDVPVKVAAVQRTQILDTPHQQQQLDFDASVSFQRRPNPNLLTIFQVTAAAILLNLLVLTVKPGFLGLMCYCLIMYWLFLGYYDRTFVTYMMGALGISVVLDIIYVLLQMMGKLGTSRPSGGKGFLVVLMIFAVIELALRLLLVAKLSTFREPPQKPEYFELFGQEIELHKRAGKKEFLHGAE